jgi:hypothetical protein
VCVSVEQERRHHERMDWRIAALLRRAVEDLAAEAASFASGPERRRHGRRRSPRIVDVDPDGFAQQGCVGWWGGRSGTSEVLRRRSASDAEDANEGIERRRPDPKGPGNGAVPRRHPRRTTRQSTIASASPRDTLQAGRGRGQRSLTSRALAPRGRLSGLRRETGSPTGRLRRVRRCRRALAAGTGGALADGRRARCAARQHKDMK